MFGYVMPEKPELKIKEYEFFRAYYCGVCKSIGKRYGHISRCVLNYDLAFLALLLSAFTDNPPNIRKESCLVHPLKKSHVILDNDIIDYASDMNVILAYYSMDDHWKDEKKISAGAFKWLLKKHFIKLRKKYGEKCVIIENRLGELEALEKEKCASLDGAAEPFARLMEEIVAYKPFCRNESDIKVLKWLGYNIGKWIYILDAYDDLEKDIKGKGYNPLIYHYKYSGEEIKSFKASILGNVEFSLVYCLSEISKAYELLDNLNKYNTGIIENIIYMGMLGKTEQILGIRSCKKK